jgi:hypothetical protein
MVFTGAILIVSLYRIRRVINMNILSSREKADFKAMLVHSAAFGLFMVSTIIISITGALYFLFSTYKDVQIGYLASLLLYSFLSFVSQWFIVVVLRNLGLKQEQDN